MLSTVIRRRASTSEYKSQSYLSIASCKYYWSSVLVDQVGAVCVVLNYLEEEAGKALEFCSGNILSEPIET